MYGIGEWFGENFLSMAPQRRQELAAAALDQHEVPRCPFRGKDSKCNKKGGVCSIQRYEVSNQRISFQVGDPVIVCPNRFEQDNLLPRWLGDIAGFDDVYLAHEVPFMRSPPTGREAGRIDVVVAGDEFASDWYGLEVQAVYFSGRAMGAEFSQLRDDNDPAAPQPTSQRRPDWRSSGAKRLMPQLEVKVPTLRRWGKKLAVAVDSPFFEAIGGVSAQPSKDFNDGDIIWLVPRIASNGRLVRHHWEVLPLEESSIKLLAAHSVRREDFEADLKEKLENLTPSS